MSTFHRNLLPPLSFIPQSIMMMETSGSSDASVHICQVTRRQIPEDGYLHIHRVKNLKSDWLALSFVCCLRGINGKFMRCLNESRIVGPHPEGGMERWASNPFFYLVPLYLRPYHSIFISAVFFTGSLCLLNTCHITPTSVISSRSLDLPRVFVFDPFILLIGLYLS